MMLLVQETFTKNSFQGGAMKTLILILLSLLLCFTFLAKTPRLYATEYNEAQELVDKGTVVFKSFVNDPDPNLDWFRKIVVKAKAVLIIPQMLKAGFLVGGSGGTGVLVSQDKESGEWSYPVFYTMGSVSLGVQIGAESSEVILMIMTDRGMDKMLTTNFKLGADVSIAAGPVGGGTKSATVDVLCQIKGCLWWPLH